MHKHNLPNNHYIRKRIVLSAFCIIALGLILSMERVSKLSIADNQKNNKIPGILSEGIIIDSLKVMNLDGKEEIVKLRGQKKATVIYVFVPACPSSVRNLENIKRLVTRQGKSYHFIGLSLHKAGFQEFIDVNKPGFPIHINSAGNAKQFGLGSVPQTIIISPEGRILKNWLGTYSKSLKSEVEKHFKIRLPELGLQGSCAYCLDDTVTGSIYSPGAVVKSGGRRLRCKSDGQWSATY